jgi:Cation transporting ATPase, C-terminus
LREIGVFSKRYLLRGVVFELVFAAAMIYLPPVQSVFHTAGLSLSQLGILVTFPVHRLGQRRGLPGLPATLAGVGLGGQAASYGDHPAESVITADGAVAAAP